MDVARSNHPLRVAALTIALMTWSATALPAQRREPEDTCLQRAMLRGGSDTAIVQAGSLFLPVDSTRRVADEYATMLSQGLRQFLKLPHPLPVNVVDARVLAFTTVSVEGVYRVVLHGDGHLTHPEPVGGSGVKAFDDAVIAALVTLDTLSIMPPASPNVVPSPNDSIALMLVIGPQASWRPNQPEPKIGPMQGVPLVRFRTPLLRITKEVQPLPGNRGPRYPDSLRAANVEGHVRVSFTVRADGRARMETVRVIKSSAPEFRDAVLEALRTMRFSPEEIEGCPVSTMIQMPFDFQLAR